AEVLHDAKVWQLKRRSDHLMRNGIARRTDSVRSAGYRISAHRFRPRAEDLDLYKLASDFFALVFGIHKNVCRSQRAFLSNTTPSCSSMRCCLSCGRTRRPVEHAPCAFNTRCHGVPSGDECMQKPTVRGV